MRAISCFILALSLACSLAQSKPIAVTVLSFFTFDFPPVRVPNRVKATLASDKYLSFSICRTTKWGQLQYRLLPCFRSTPSCHGQALQPLQIRGYQKQTNRRRTERVSSRFIQLSVQGTWGIFFGGQLAALGDEGTHRGLLQIWHSTSYPPCKSSLPLEYYAPTLAIEIFTAIF